MSMTSSTALKASVQLFGEEKILTVSELSRAIKQEIEKNFATVKLRGEVSGLKVHTSGHTYLSLKDSDSVINAICWRGTKVGFPLEDGLEVVVKGKVTSYPARSQYQFIIEEANIAGEGALLKLLNERRKHYASLGYFEKKQAIPRFPRIIGIITSRTGAVLQDMNHRLEDRYPFCHVMIWPVNVQGIESAEQVSRAIRGFNFMIEKRPDVLIVARGGGSIEDLWPFNEEAVVKAVFDSKIPVISAIGHETDTTLIDYAADLRAPTPTAAIELATPVLADVKLQLSGDAVRMRSLIGRIVKETTMMMESSVKRLRSSMHMICALNQRFDDSIERLFVAIENFIQKEFLLLKSRKLINLESYITNKQCGYEVITRSFSRIMKNFITIQGDKLTVLSNRLDQGSFKKILSKGFCFITDTCGAIISTKTDFDTKKVSNLVIHFQDGTTNIR
ncbi:MAG: exodeoxyribonuclease VII large subunit [Holosporales bacterium]|jgi:exodeoxyribonuclease VII large subunit|nr:exodeoxyribonuclease VII large subunit [Holosporales bacterium]